MSLSPQATQNKLLAPGVIASRFMLTSSVVKDRIFVPAEIARDQPRQSQQAQLAAMAIQISANKRVNLHLNGLSVSSTLGVAGGTFYANDGTNGILNASWTSPAIDEGSAPVSSLSMIMLGEIGYQNLALSELADDKVSWTHFPGDSKMPSKKDLSAERYIMHIKPLDLTAEYPDIITCPVFYGVTLSTQSWIFTGPKVVTFGEFVFISGSSATYWYYRKDLIAAFVGRADLSSMVDNNLVQVDMSLDEEQRYNPANMLYPADVVVVASGIVASVPTPIKE